MSKLIAFLCCAFSISAFANCESGDLLLSKNVLQAVKEYEKCALNENDDEAQLKLAEIYSAGKKNVQQNEMKALLFCHLSADNGNAMAQTKLAEMLLELDASDDSRQKIVSYMKQIKLALKKNAESSFDGEVLHPYTLLVLASEPSVHKWYYPTKTKYSTEALKLLQNYQIDDKKKAILMKQASLWKQRKMMETAQEVLSKTEFKKFKETVYPSKGQPDSFARRQAVTELKEKVENYLK